MFSRPPRSRHALLTLVLLAGFDGSAVFAQQAKQSSKAAALPRTPDGKPNLQGIWQVRAAAANNPAADLSTKGIVEGGAIPYLPAAATKRQQNFTNRKTADPLAQCFMPGVPRIMYMQYPFQIFQTPEHIAITFEWSQVYRLLYLNGKPSLHEVVDSWMGDSRAHWEGDTLVVQVTGQNDKTWFDLAGNFHSDEMKVTERYTMLDADTIQYEASIDDPKTFAKTWKISVPLARQKNVARLLEYQCQDKAEEARGDFERDPRTWYPDPGAPPSPLGKPAPIQPAADLPPVKPGANFRRAADGKPDLTGYFQSNAGGANYGLEKHGRDAFTPATRGVVIDPADGTLPYQPWARAERINREEPYRGYDDPTAHCFVAGVPRSMYVPSPLQILQPPGYVVLLFERMSWRIIPLGGPIAGRAHLAENVRLWQGDSLGYWEGDTLVVDTTNMNGKTWLNEVGDVVSYAQHTVERFTPIDDGTNGAKRINYRATVTDPIAYTRPWTIEVPLNGNADELLEVACHEDNGDLQNLKAVRDEHRAQQKKGK